MKKNLVSLMLAALIVFASVTTAQASRSDVSFNLTDVSGNLNSSAFPTLADSVAGIPVYFQLDSDTDHCKLYIREPGSTNWKLESVYDSSGYFLKPVRFKQSGIFGIRVEMKTIDGRTGTLEGTVEVKEVSNNRNAAISTEYKNWKQMDGRWANAYIGSEMMRTHGSVVASVAMLAVQGGFESVTSGFNPGVLLQRLKNVGAFVDNNLCWRLVGQVIHGLDYHKKITLSGSAADKLATIKQYYDADFKMLVSVKNGAHWVAIDSVTSTNAKIMDPACNATDLFNYNASGVTQIRLFK